MRQKKYFGVVEGFFSAPRKMWSNDERINLLKFIIKHCPNLNTYFYCPKDDPFVRIKWSRLYSKQALDSVKKVFNLCHKAKLAFIYGLNPDFDLAKIKKDYPAYLKTITKKLNQLKQIGIKDFCILYDDIPFAYNVTEKAKEENDNYIGQIHARVLNDLLKNFKNSKFWLCPPDYFFQEKTPYLKALCANLSREILLLWTGHKIFTPFISRRLLQKTQTNLNPGRKLIWWDNYPVNDCEHIKGTFHIGAFNHPKPSVLKNLQGALINPMREAYANYPAFYTASLFMENQQKYNREQALKAFFKKFFGSNWESFFRIYTSFSNKNCVDNEPREYMKKLSKINSKKELAKILASFKKDLETIDNDKKTKNKTKQNFLKETNYILKKAKIYLKIFEAILNQTEWEKAFIELDKFPVTARKEFLTKIYDVTTKKFKFLTRKKAESLKLKHTYRSIKKIYAKYQGISRLKITPKDNEILLNQLEDFLKTERNCFKKHLKDLSKTQKIKEIVKRSFINVY
ncbi:MAG: hypothetical protein GF347_02765 [Candidatus Moranbacteria bacterium]|nr:hypothetical protein [Candidatus Moranbacteria bacterium]